MSPEEAFDAVVASVAAQAYLDPKNVAIEADLVSDIGLDSFGVIQVALDLEDRLGTALDDEVLADVRTVRDLVRAASTALSAGRR